jgi:GGDEF domain-containing protein
MPCPFTIAHFAIMAGNRTADLTLGWRRLSLILRDSRKKNVAKPRQPKKQTAGPAHAAPVGSRAARIRANCASRGAALAAQLAAEVERLQGELAAARAEMAVLAAHAEIDPLTELLNRRGFERELKRAIAHGKRYGTRAALIYLDLDHFKPVNDRHGHAAGDAVLRAVAEVLTRHVRASDLVARLGGDEFAVMLWRLSEADAQRKAL